jgi:hypothetical protein
MEAEMQEAIRSISAVTGSCILMTGECGLAEEIRLTVKCGGSKTLLIEK